MVQEDEVTPYVSFSAIKLVPCTDTLSLAGFMFGLRDWDENGNPIYRTFTKVGGGYNIDTYEKIFSETRGQWFEADEPPSWFVTKSQIPNLYIDPTKSVLLS